ncbi:MAG: tetratricopeptide repeat protein, partial [Planctomycetota bacterium]
EPLIPSKKYSSFGEQSMVVATRRKTDPQKLGQQLRGELDWIVMKTLDKDRNRRYESPKALAADVENYLNNDNVEACPPSLGYQFQKFARRHTILFRGAAAVFVALLLGVIASTALWLDAAEARDAAVTAQAESEAIADFLFEDIIAVADPEFEPNRDITLRQVLDQATERLEGKFEHTPLVEAAIKFRLGKTYTGLGQYTQAYELLDSAMAIRATELTREHPLTLEAMEHFANTFGSSRWVEANRKLLDELIETRTRTLGAHHPDTLRARLLKLHKHLWSDSNRAIDRMTPQRLAQDEKEIASILEEQTKRLGANHLDVLQTRHTLRNVYVHQGRDDEATTELEEIYQAQLKALGENHPKTIYTMSALAGAYIEAGVAEEHQGFLEKTLKLAHDVMGKQARATFEISNSLVLLHIQRGEFTEALASLTTLANEPNITTIRRSGLRIKIAILHAWMNDREAHATYTRAFLTEHALTEDPRLADKTAKAVLAWPDGIDKNLLRLAVEQARKATRYGDPNHHAYSYFNFVHGLAEFRVGNYDQAVEWFVKINKEVNEQAYINALPYHAMALHHLGDPGAPQLFQQAYDTIAHKAFDGNNWHDIMIAKMGLDEAKALIKVEGEAETE